MHFEYAYSNYIARIVIVGSPAAVVPILQDGDADGRRRSRSGPGRLRRRCHQCRRRPGLLGRGLARRQGQEWRHRTSRLLPREPPAGSHQWLPHELSRVTGRKTRTQCLSGCSSVIIRLPGTKLGPIDVRDLTGRTAHTGSPRVPHRMRVKATDA